MKIDEYFMNLALNNAKLSELKGEVPVGAIIVKDDEVIANGFNQREFGKNALYHAEFTEPEPLPSDLPLHTQMSVLP